ncbi:MAG: AI-2E family transporter [Candidatus Gastranaerophilales bacterium]|nr:AI-2E family transporter [Candidatus Gastranaerophilales bacterium]
MNRFVNKYLNTKNILFFIVVILIIAFTIMWKDVTILFFTSFVIACSLNPIVDKMEKRMSRGLAASIVMTMFVSAILLIFLPVCFISAQEIKVFATSFPAYVDKIDDYLLSCPILAKFDFSPIDLESVFASASASSNEIINHVIDFGRNLSIAFVFMIVSLIIIFNMLLDKVKLENFYLSLFPPAMQSKAKEIGEMIADKMGKYLVALVATMAGVSIVMLIGLNIFGIEYALILSLITGVLDIIPVIGPTLALIICLIMVYKFGMGAIGAVIITFSVAQLIENNFVRPYVFGKFLDLHPLIIFLFLFIAAGTMGIVGVIFAPALAVLCSVLFNELYIKKIKEE